MILRFRCGFGLWLDCGFGVVGYWFPRLELFGHGVLFVDVVCVVVWEWRWSFRFECLGLVCFVLGLVMDLV